MPRDFKKAVRFAYRTLRFTLNGAGRSTDEEQDRTLAAEGLAELLYHWDRQSAELTVDEAREAAQQLGQRAAGKAKSYSPEELDRRRERLAEARKKRWNREPRPTRATKAKPPPR